MNQSPNHHQLVLLVLLLFFTSRFSSGQQWDGVAITHSDFQSLQALKHDFVDFKGVLRTWNNAGYGACSGGWAGIKCAKGRVIALQLPWKELGGRISEKISQLQALRRISLHDNVLSGPLPYSLGLLPNLRGVYLFNNRLSGSIPSTISNSPLLRTLDVSKNQLTGRIPPSFANSTRLFRFNLSFNSISGSIPLSLTQSPSLTFLALQHNHLSGSVPDSWAETGKKMKKTHQLRILTLDYNLLSGSIPTSLTKLGSLEMLSLSHNQIDGTIPSELGSLQNLQIIDLSHNAISGHIPSSLSNLPNLTHFNVSFNNLSGPVPSPLSRRFNSTSFIGNFQLCGYSASAPCPSPPPRILPSSSLSSKHRHRKLSTKDIILIAAGALLLILLLLCCVLLFCLIRKKTTSKANNGKKSEAVEGRGGASSSVGEVESSGGKLVHFDGPFMFTADDLLCATAEIMGKSSYGTVYKASLEDGNHVAVKRLREKVAKGQKEFETEAAVLGKIRHPNVLALRAYYLGPKGEKLLVFDYMPNGSLASFLHARGPEMTVTWGTRMKIAMGITRGLNYLHTQENIIHGNLTSSSVLLDEQTNPKISEVGLCRLMTSAANTNVIATAGTLGYRAPELSKLKNATTKTDVYSLGVIILELLTGKSPGEAADGADLPQWVASNVKDEWTNEVFDVELVRDASNSAGGNDELLNTLKLALHCVDPSPPERPEAHQVLRQLEEIKPELAATSDDGAQASSAKSD